MSVKFVVLLFLVVLFLIFIFQNIETVSVSFLMFEMNMPRALLLIITFMVGLLAGIFIPFEYRRSRSKKEIR